MRAKYNTRQYVRVSRVKCAVVQGTQLGRGVPCQECRRPTEYAGQAGSFPPHPCSHHRTTRTTLNLRPSLTLAHLHLTPDHPHLTLTRSFCTLTPRTPPSKLRHTPHVLPLPPYHRTTAPYTDLASSDACTCTCASQPASQPHLHTHAHLTTCTHPQSIHRSTHTHPLAFSIPAHRHRHPRHH